MLKFGFELEGFISGDDDEILPPHQINDQLPLDGFPGLVELRSTGGKELIGAYTDIINEYIRLRLKYSNTHFDKWEHTYPGDELAWMRAHCDFTKQRVSVHNIYGHKTRNVGKKTLASLQINISNEITPAYEIMVEDYVARKISPHYGLLDIPRIVRNLDKEFSSEIKASGRQPGMYAIKWGYRLEYRSLPNAAFVWELDKSGDFLERINKAVS